MEAMLRKVKETIQKNHLIDHDMHIVLGLSGGPDSMCLFDVLCELAEEWNLKIYPVHVNHRFRPGDAEKDQEYVEKFCMTRGWPCRSFTYDCVAIAREENLTSEEAGRKVRYQSFFRQASDLMKKGIPAEKIRVAVAQNARDQAETILFRVIRGTGTDGLAGIAYLRYEMIGDKKIGIIRPLLDVDRPEIEEYCAMRNLNPRIDHTNQETVYTRNKIRLMLLPLLEKNFNPAVVSTVGRLGKIASMDRDFIETAAQNAFETCWNEEEQAFDTEKLAKLHPSVRFRVYQLMLKKLGFYEGLTMAQMDTVEKIRESSSPSAAACLNGFVTVSRIYDKLKFFIRKENKLKRQTESSNVETGKVSERVFEDEQRIYILKRIGASEYEKLHPLKEGVARGVFRGEQVVQPGCFEKLEVRFRQEGDFLTIRNQCGEIKRKKLQDFLVDEKVPRLYRDEICVLALGHHVLWVLPSAHFLKPELREKGRFSASLTEDRKSASDIEESIIILEVSQKIC